MSIYDELKKIEDELEGEEYTDSGISYYFACDLVPATRKKAEAIRDILIRNKVIGKNDHAALAIIEDYVSDFKTISDEWHFNEQIKKRFLNIFKETDRYYRIMADGSYASYGNLWSICRVLQKGEETVLLEFYITD